MKKLLLILPLLALGGCATSAGSFTGAVVREAVRGPTYVIERPYYRPIYRPVYRPYWRQEWQQESGW